MPQLYDVHTHVGLDLGFMLRGWWPYACTAQDLLERMDANGIARAVCFPFTLPSAFDPYAFADRGDVAPLGGRVPFDRENARLVEEVGQLGAGERLIPFAMFDPARRAPQQVDLLEPIVGRIGGLKAQTTVLRSPVLALLDVGRHLMAFAQRHDLPVLLHTAVNPADAWAQAADCLLVAEAYPRVRFCLAHSLRFHAPLLRRAAQLPNVWVDCSAHLAHCHLARQDSPVVAPPTDRVDADYSSPAHVLQAIHALLGGCYLWGSDNPYMSWCDDRLRLVFSYREEAAVLHALPDDVRLGMAHDGPRAWLFGNRGGEQ